VSEAETNSGARDAGGSHRRLRSQAPRSVEPHLPLPVELPLVDEPGGTDVDLKTQIVRFVLTGLLSAVVDFSLTILLQYGLDVQLTAAKAVGFLLGTTTAYLINRRWTFNAPPSRRRFVAVVALYAATFAVQTALYTVFGHLWPETVLYSALGFLIAQGTATVINFVVQRAVIFKIH
jgi:putative flippase GtrA